MSEKEISIAEAMDLILNGRAKTASLENTAYYQIVEAANILKEAGFEDEAQIVLYTLNEESINKKASIEMNEEVLFEVTSDKVLS